MVRGDRGDDWDDGCTDSERDQTMDASVQSDHLMDVNDINLSARLS